MLDNYNYVKKNYQVLKQILMEEPKALLLILIVWMIKLIVYIIICNILNLVLVEQQETRVE